MVDLTLWCLLCGRDAANGIAIKNLMKSSLTTISGFTKIKFSTKGAPKRICTDCDTFLRCYEKQKKHYDKVQEMFTFALKKHRKPEELLNLRTKFGVVDELRDWKSLEYVDVKVKLERLDNSLFESFTVNSIDEYLLNPETELVVKAEPIETRPDSPETIPFLPQYSPESDLPDKFDNSPPPSLDEDSDSGGLSDHFEFTGGTKRKVKFINKYPTTTYECDFCGFTICWKRAMMQHMKAKHTERQEIFKCKECPKTYKKSDSLNSHFYRLHRKQPLPKISCELCKKKFTSESGLKYHVNSVHENRRDYQCSICSKMFITRGSLTQHEETHEESKKFQCSICSKRWNTGTGLKRHMKRHSRVACCCDICGIKVVSAEQLRRHKETVHGGKVEHTCIVCGKEFSRSKNYKTHLIAMHTDLRPYTCRFCNRTFNNGANCAKHKREAHPVEYDEDKKNFDLKPVILPSFKELHARIQAKFSS